MLSSAILNVGRYFVKISFVVSNKWSAVVALSTTLWIIYKPRLDAYNFRLEQERKADAPPPASVNDPVIIN